MVSVKRVILLFSIIFMLVLPFVLSAETVVVQQTQKPEKAGWFDTYFGFLKNPIFWYAILGIFLFFLILLGLVFLIKWLVKYFKSQNDIFYKLRVERIKMAKVMKRYNSKHWFKVTQNTPIRLVRNINGKAVISSPVGYHRGDFTTQEGNVFISMNLNFDKKWLFLPMTSLLVIPNKEKYIYHTKDDKGKPKEIEVTNLPRANEIVQYNEGEILLYCESLSNIGMFYMPVITAKDGKIIDLTVPVFQSIKEVVVGNYLFDQTDEFTKVAKKSIDMNPNLRYDIKNSDNSNVEVPSSNQQLQK